MTNEHDMALDYMARAEAAGYPATEDSYAAALAEVRRPYEPYTCHDRECREREATGKRCPWCWGGFPTGTPAQDVAVRDQYLGYWGS